MRFWFGRSQSFAGMNAGVNIDATAFFRRLWRVAAPRGSKMIGSFVYVISAGSDVSKIGVSTDPNGRIADLQTGSPHPLHFELIAMTTGQGYDIESLAHDMLDKHRMEGEWFAVPPSMAVAAVHTSAHELGHQITPVSRSLIDATASYIQLKSRKLTGTGKVLASCYIAACALVDAAFPGHFISVIVVGALGAWLVIKPVLNWRFMAPIEP